jgi:hypothetical protein
MDDRRRPWKWLKFGETLWRTGADNRVGIGLRRFVQDSLEFPIVPDSSDDLLEGMQLLRRVEEEAQELLVLLIAEARSLEVSWTAIGKMLGVGRTAAQKRYGPLLADVERSAIADVRRALDRAKEKISWALGDDDEISDAEDLLRRYGLDRRGRRLPSGDSPDGSPSPP